VYLFFYLFWTFLLIYLPTRVFITYLLLFVHCFTCLFFHYPTVLSCCCLRSTSSSLKHLRSAVKLKRWNSWSSNRNASGHDGAFLKTPTSIILHPLNFQPLTDIYILISTEVAVSLIGAIGSDTLLQRLLPLGHLLSSLLSHRTGYILTMKHTLRFIGYCYKFWEECVISTYRHVLQLMMWHHIEISLKTKKLDNSLIMTAELLHIHKQLCMKFFIMTNMIKFSFKATCISDKLVWLSSVMQEHC